MIRILIADDHLAVREGMKRILEQHPDLRVTAEAEHGDELLRLLESAPADVLILDISMPGPGFSALLGIIHERCPLLPVLIVSMHPVDEWAIRAFQQGAVGYLTKRHTAEELVEAVRRAHAGGHYVTPAVAELFADRLGPNPRALPHEALSKREFEVMCLLGSGKMIKNVAKELGLSPRTVSTYRARILEKLGLRNTPEIVRYVVEHDLSL